MPRVDLNCDMGESFGRWTLGHDTEVMASITSANVACGFHAGDPEVMRRTVRLAKEHGVAVGAHPGLPDLAGFGRREMQVSPRELEDMMLYQIARARGHCRGRRRLLAACQTARCALQHDVPRSRAVRRHRARSRLARPAADPAGAARLRLIRAGENAGLRTAGEGFADRAYQPDGSLAAETPAGSVIHDPDVLVARAVRMVRDGGVVATDGSWVPLNIQTLCTHGDTPGAHELVARLRAALESQGLTVAPLGASAR